jgi:hypothetical protein
MKKYVLMLMSLFMMVCSANAQIKDDIQKSKERAAKLQALCNDYKTSGSANVDLLWFSKMDVKHAKIVVNHIVDNIIITICKQ